MFVRPSRDGLTSQQVLAALREALPEDALVSCDVGSNKSVSIQCWPAYAPRTFFVSNGLSSMGYGLPAAIGLKLAHPDTAVACVLGDGGFAMSLAELETAARLGRLRDKRGRLCVLYGRRRDLRLAIIGADGASGQQQHP